jgi:hypothetical protein
MPTATGKKEARKKSGEKLLRARKTPPLVPRSGTRDWTKGTPARNREADGEKKGNLAINFSLIDDLGRVADFIRVLRGGGPRSEGHKCGRIWAVGSELPSYCARGPPPGVRHEPSDADRAAGKGRTLSKVNLFLGCLLRYRWCAWLDLLRGPRTTFEMHKTGLGCVRVFAMEMWKHMI